VGRDAQALVLLGFVAAVAMAGFAMLVTGSSRGARILERGGAPTDAGQRLAARMDRRLRRTRAGRRLADWLAGAGVRLSPFDYLAAVAAAGAVSAAVLSLILGERAALIAGLAVAVGGGRWYVERERGRRVEQFVGQLPDTARTLSNATAAGLSLPQAIRLGGRELPDPAGAELRRVAHELDLGRPLDEALDGLRRRLPSREVQVLMTTMVIQQRAGGDTVRALAELGETLEARKDLLREIRTLLAGSVYTGYLVPVVAFGVVLLMNAISPGVIEELTSSLLGLVVLVAAGGLWGVALVLIRRTTRVDW
jgi:tight adherence protein B